MASSPTPFPNRAIVERGDTNGETGEQAERSREYARDHDEFRAADPVRVVPERHREKNRHRNVDDDESDEPLVGEVEALLNLRRKRGESGRVEFVKEEQRRQNRERENRFALRVGFELATEKLDHVMEAPLTRWRAVPIPAESGKRSRRVTPTDESVTVVN